MEIVTHLALQNGGNLRWGTTNFSPDIETEVPIRSKRHSKNIPDYGVVASILLDGRHAREVDWTIDKGTLHLFVVEKP